MIYLLEKLFRLLPDKTASDFVSAREKVKKLKRLVDRGEHDTDLAIYIPGVLELV